MQKTKYRVRAGCRGSTVSSGMHFLPSLSRCQSQHWLILRLVALLENDCQQQSEQHASFFTSSRRERLGSFSKIPFLVLCWLMFELRPDKRDRVTLIDLG